MKDHHFIGDIICRLWKKSVTAEELKELSSELERDTPSDDMNHYLLNTWDTTPKHPSELDKKKMLSSIHEKIMTGGPKQLISSYTAAKTRQVWLSTWKYAAVFVLAFSIAWLIKSLVQQDNYPAPLANQGMNEIMVSYGSKSKIHLPDGSVVNLNSGSKLIYPAVFTEKERQVYLEGEAHFEVKADSAHPFFVKTSDISVRVLGTVFNIRSYPESSTIVTTLVSGSLEIEDIKGSRLSLQKSAPVVLKPNQKAVYVKDLNSLTITEKEELKAKNASVVSDQMSLQKDIDTHLETAWKDNQLIFDNQYFESLVIQLERWYNVTIDIKSPDLKRERFTGKFENESIEQVLNALKMAEPLGYKMTKNHIEIYSLP
ncbi:MAG: DUF4974 domain-containing protein [Bacteroidales bacterium]|nr:DUF4974 domain-containing protein [Bacteroidales bacterium]